MSEEEKRAIRAASLLEYEEAKAALALLRVKADQWSALHERVTHLLARMRRDSAHLESAAASAGLAIRRDHAAVAAVMDLDAVLALDRELSDALERLKKADAAKRELGFQ